MKYKKGEGTLKSAQLRMREIDLAEGLLPKYLV